MDKSSLFNFLSVVSPELKRRITLVAAGGTAMTLLDLKTSTIDIDFTGPGEDMDEFNRVIYAERPGLKIDVYKDGAVFSQKLPEDYITKSISIKIPKKYKVENIDLRTLYPIDIIVTKVGRLAQRDEDDIAICIQQYKPDKLELEERGRYVMESYPGNEHIYKNKLYNILSKFY